MKIVLASNNAGKLNEMQPLLASLQCDLILQSTCHVPEIEETGLSFVENAILKARHASAKTDLPAIADDSGLCVDALSGAPGIYSARFAGPNASSKDNIEKLLHQMSDKENRKAQFYCVIVFVRNKIDPMPIICQAAWEGIILNQMRGENGFGYDPIFYLPSLDKTAAELSLDKKNQISHRGQALKRLIDQLNLSTI